MFLLQSNVRTLDLTYYFYEEDYLFSAWSASNRSQFEKSLHSFYSVSLPWFGRRSLNLACLVIFDIHPLFDCIIITADLPTRRVCPGAGSELVLQGGCMYACTYPLISSGWRFYSNRKMKRNVILMMAWECMAGPGSRRRSRVFLVL